MKQRTISYVVLIFGVMLIIFGSFTIVQFEKRSRILFYQVPLKVTPDESPYLVLDINITGSLYLLKIRLDVGPAKVGPALVWPVLSIVMIDDDGFRMFRMGEAPEHLYLRAVNIQNSTTFTLTNLSVSGRYYLVFSNAMPTTAKILVSAVEEYEYWSVNLYSAIFLASGVFLSFLGLVLRR